MKLYLESTVPFMLFAEENPHRRAITELFLKWIKSRSDKIYVSSLLEEEIRHTSATQCAVLISQLQKLPLIMLETPPAAARLADRYIAAGIVPEAFRCGILHVAVAVCHELDVVLSWNTQSIVNLQRVARVCEFNARHGLPPVRIQTPEMAMSLP